MNYQRIYKEFIADRILKQDSINGYFEKHHILPRSLGGDNSKDNIIKLTAQDHYFAHKVLAKIHGLKMVKALLFMSRINSSSAKFIKTRKDYDYVRKNYSKYLKIINKGENNPRYGKKCSNKTKELIAKGNEKYKWRDHPRANNSIHIWVNMDSGEIFIGSHFDLSEKKKLDRSMLARLVKGTFVSHKKWMCVDVKRENKRIGLSNNSADKKIYSWISPSGEIVKSTRYELSRQHNLTSYNLGNLVSGKSKTHKGWRYLNED